MATPSGKEKIFTHFMKAPDFELTHNADSHYPDIEPHYHEFYELSFFVSGHVSHIIADQSVRLQNGDLAVIPPNILHNPRFEDFNEVYERYVLWVNPKVIEEIISANAELSFFTDEKKLQKRFLYRPTRRDFLLLNTCFKLLEECFTAKRTLWRTEFKALLTLILTEYNRSLMVNDKRTDFKEGYLPIGEILGFIHSNLAQDLSLESVASKFCMSKFSLAHLFKKYCGISFYQYLLQQRLMVGKELILNGTPAQEASRLCGFRDYSNFYRAFFKEYEISPAALKKIKGIPLNAQESLLHN